MHPLTHASSWRGTLLSPGTTLPYRSYSSYDPESQNTNANGDKARMRPEKTATVMLGKRVATEEILLEMLFIADRTLTTNIM
jgi:hypothetical protein